MFEASSPCEIKSFVTIATNWGRSLITAPTTTTPLPNLSLSQSPIFLRVSWSGASTLCDNTDTPEIVCVSSSNFATEFNADFRSDSSVRFFNWLSPKKARAPRSMALVYSSSLDCTLALARIFSLTSFCTSFISFNVTACGWVKSNRNLSDATYEPACRTWVPRTCRRAAWTRCVLVWFLAVSSLRTGWT